MPENQQIVDLWKRAREQGEAPYLATVVHVQGSSYRKPGARMLVTSGGQKAGGISGGCLEGEVAKKIAWLTHTGPTIQRYSSSFDDENEGVSYGLGCGGIIWVLMESGSSVIAILAAMEDSLERRLSSIIVAHLSEERCGTVLVRPKDSFAPPYFSCDKIPERPEALSHLAIRALEDGEFHAVPTSGELPEFVCMPILAPPRLTIFGAGDDAEPIVRFAGELGWQVTVADGRSHLLRQERFPGAKSLQTLIYTSQDSESGDFEELRWRELADSPEVSAGDLAVILTHSYEQDRALLQALLPLPLCYLGILGPLHRTMRLLNFVAPSLGLSIEESLARLHAPVGLDLGSGEPAVIALAIIAQMQATVARTLGSVGRIAGGRSPNMESSSSQRSSIEFSDKISGLSLSEA